MTDLPSMREALKNHMHHVRRLRAGSRDRYECLDCGKRLRILSGVIVDEHKYMAQKEADFARYLRRLAGGEL